MSYVEELEKQNEQLKDKYSYLDNEYPRILSENEFLNKRLPKWLAVENVNAFNYILGSLMIATIWMDYNKSKQWSYKIHVPFCKNCYTSCGGGFPTSDAAKRNAERAIYE